MLKLNENYSDYVDMTDENYPEGKAINASSSESFDGTPLLADFMNDMVGAKQAMYKKAYGNTSGIDGKADSVESSQFVDAVTKLIDDKDKAHDVLRGKKAHGATVAATANQLISRDGYGRAKIASPNDDEDIVNKAYVDNHIERTGENAHGATVAATANQLATRDSSGKLFGKTSATGSNPTISKTDELVSFTALYNALFPVGFVYTQYPGEKSPSELKMPGTWTEIKFGGAFFRSAGGNAKAFTSSFACAVSGDGLTITFSKKPTSSQLAAGDILIYDSQFREVKSYNASSGVAVVTSAFSNPSKITTVIIGQNSANKSHGHSINDPGHSHYIPFGSNTDYKGDVCYEIGTWCKSVKTAPEFTGITINLNGDVESRPINITKKLWKRIG